MAELSLLSPEPERMQWQTSNSGEAPLSMKAFPSVGWDHTTPSF